MNPASGGAAADDKERIALRPLLHEPYLVLLARPAAQKGFVRLPACDPGPSSSSLSLSVLPLRSLCSVHSEAFPHAHQDLTPDPAQLGIFIAFLPLSFITSSSLLNSFHAPVDGRSSPCRHPPASHQIARSLLRLRSPHLPLGRTRPRSRLGSLFRRRQMGQRQAHPRHPSHPRQLFSRPSLRDPLRPRGPPRHPYAHLRLPPGLRRRRRMVQRLLRAANHRPLFRRRVPRRHHRQRPHNHLHRFPPGRFRLVYAERTRGVFSTAPGLPRHLPRRSPPPLPRHPRSRWRPCLLGRSALRRKRTQRHPFPHRRRSFRGQQSLRSLPRPSAQSHHRRKPRRLPETLHPAPRIHLAPVVPSRALRPFLPHVHQHPHRPLRVRQIPPPRRPPPPLITAALVGGRLLPRLYPSAVSN